MAFLEDKRPFWFAFFGCLCALVDWAAAIEVLGFVREAIENNRQKQDAIARCIEDNASPREYRSSVREYCEEVYRTYIR
jgi:hypothetical protein